MINVVKTAGEKRDSWLVSQALSQGPRCQRFHLMSQPNDCATKQRGGSLMRACRGDGNRGAGIDCLDQKTGMAGAVKLPTVDGGLNRRQNVRFLIPHYSPLYTIQDQCTDSLQGRSRDQLQVERLLKGEQVGNSRGQPLGMKDLPSTLLFKNPYP